MVGFLGRNDGSIGDEGEVDTWVGHKICLELCEIHVQCTVETKGGRDGGDDLADQTVEVGVGGSLDIQVPAADIVDCLVVYHEGTVRVFQSGMGGED